MQFYSLVYGGAGKTYFIDNYIKDDTKTNVKYVKISLFGLKEVNDLHIKIIFELLDSNKLNNFFEKVSNVVSTVINKKLNLSAQDIPLDVILKNTNDTQLILIFDDFERKSIESKEVLGYINYLVEICKLKTIILANEDKLKKDDIYSDFKEKIIGKTFIIENKIDNLINSFFSPLTKSKDTLIKNKETLIKAFNIANYKNLRHIKQCLLDFEYVFLLIDQKFIKNEKFLKDFLYVFCALYFEVKNNFLIKKDLKKDISINFQNKSKKNSINQLRDKYGLQGTISLVLPISLWIDIMYKNKIDDNKLNEAISETHYFSSRNIPDWETLCRFTELDDDDFLSSLEYIYNRFKKNHYIRHEELLHISSSLLYFSKIGLLNETQESIIEQAKKNINNNLHTEFWLNNLYNNEYNPEFPPDYEDKESNEFQIIHNEVLEKSLISFTKGLTAKAIILLNKLNNEEFSMFFNEIYNQYDSIPIFKYMNSKQFINEILKIDNSYLYTIGKSLKELYTEGRVFSEEKTFWENVNQTILLNVNKNKKPLKYYLLNDFKDSNISKILSTLEFHDFIEY